MMKTMGFQLNLFLVLLVLLIAGQSRASDSLKYVEHSFVKIKTAGGMIMYIDPALTNSFEDYADVVLISHEHMDHNDLSRVKRKQSCIVIRAADALKAGVYQTFTFGNVSVKAVPAYNSNHPKSSCVGFIISIPTADSDTIKLYHPGDTGKIPEMADLASQNITYALLPMDGTYTMTPQEATAAAAMIHAKHDIPIHTKPGVTGYSDSKVALFTSPNKMVIKPGTNIPLTNTTTSVEEGSISKTESYKLFQNYPNPFNPVTIISYQVPKMEHVELNVFDLFGRKIETLVNKNQNAGSYQVAFNGRNLASGIYFYRINTGSFSSTKKMILAK